MLYFTGAYTPEFVDEGRAVLSQRKIKMFIPMALLYKTMS